MIKEMSAIDFASAKLVRILDQNERMKFTAYLTMIKSDGQAEPVESVILAEKTSFDASGDLSCVFGAASPQCTTSIQLIDQNDIYYRYVLKVDGIAAVKFQIIHPATPKHIAKYTKQDRMFVKETPELYRSTVEPYINSNPASRLQWIQNILEEKSEVESTLHHERDPKDGFFLLYDSKWDRRNISGLYLLIIAKDGLIRSLRDIRGEHLGLLKRAREVINEVVPKQFPGLKASQLRCFIHYQPTYYHFHIHVVHVDMDGVGAMVGQAHLLDDVIDNIEQFGSDYYQKKTLTYTLGVEHALYKLINQ